MEEQDVGGDGVWVGAASPRLKAALGALVGHPLHRAHREKAAAELEKHEQAERIEQLAARRSELAAEIAAWSALARTSLLEGDEALRKEVKEAVMLSAREQRSVAAEVRTVREQYDTMRWKRRWSPRPETLHPRPSTLDPRPSTLHPTPSTLHPTPYKQM